MSVCRDFFWIDFLLPLVSCHDGNALWIGLLFFNTRNDPNKRGTMHGVMEGPGEELTVAAIASDGLDDGHHHHHLNGVTTASLLENGVDSVSPPPKDASQPLSPPTATATNAADNKKEEVAEVTSPATPPATSPAAASPAKPTTADSEDDEDDVADAPSSKSPGDADALASPEASSERPSERSPEPERPSDVEDAVKEHPLEANAENTKDKNDEPSRDDVQNNVGSAIENKELKTCEEEENLLNKASVKSPADKMLPESKESEAGSDLLENPEESVLPAEEPSTDAVSVKIEKDITSNFEEVPCSIEESKELSLETDANHDDEASASSGSEVSMRDNNSGDSEEGRMEIDISPTDVKTEVIEDQEKSTDSGIVSEQPSRKISQKRTSDEDLFTNEAKKPCLPDIVCGDANALDLSGMKKKDPKEPKIALKPQSLLLSKLQGTSDSEKAKKDNLISENTPNRSGDSSHSNKMSRRRSSRDDKDNRSNYQRRVLENHSNRVLERDQVLREMRTRVRSSYKERERVAKEDSLLRDLLEPERETFISDYIEAAMQCGGLLELDRVSSVLDAELQQLTVEINAKEAEWNDLIRKKKLKEELALRVRRRKQVLALSGENEDELVRRNSFEDDPRLEPKRDLNMEARLDRRHEPFRDVTPKTGEELLAAALRLGSRNVEDYHHRSSSSSPLARVLMGAVSSSGSACRLSPSVSLSAIPTPTSTSSVLNASLPSAAVQNKNFTRVDKQASAANASRMQRPILPKPSTATSGGHVVSDSSLDGSGKGIIGEGRQGPIIDVQSIIADYRSQHPENVPRRGRRMKPSGMVSDSIMASARPGSSSGGGLLSMSLPALGSGSHVRTGASVLHGGAAVDLSELGFVLSSGAGSDGPSRPSSTESSLSGATSQVNQESSSGMSFKDVLVQFAKMTNSNEQSALGNQGALLNRPPPPPYPEVTLHPVVTPAPIPSPVPASTPTTSLLHGILTKSHGQSSNSGNQSHNKPTTFSPTLARLLTAPERSSVSGMMNTNTASVLPTYQTSTGSGYCATGPVLLSDLLSGGSSKKARSELTITPVSASSNPLLLPSTHNSRKKANEEVVVLDGEDAGDMNGDEGDADTDSDERRLVIDEGDNGEIAESDGRLDRSKNTVPHCQGCNERDAEFVCAGCQRQWYCSRECQIAAWDEHSEQCFPSNDN